jgi:putative pyridoxal-dependent aspartate 1-decarboxylase
MNEKKNFHTPNPAKPLVADWDALMRTFIRPENAAARDALLKYMEQVLFGLHDFLKTHVGITQRMSLKDLAARYRETDIGQSPQKRLTEVISDLVEEIAPHAVNVASPYFVGHMTSAIPFFMVHLETLVSALNQNVVKLETSKVLSVLEKQVLAKIHRLLFKLDDDFYAQHVQNADTTLGCFTEDGTLANITALWVARNRYLAPKPGFDGVEAEGLPAALRAYHLDRLVILVSRLAHFSLRKALGVLGVGHRGIIPLEVDERGRVLPNALLDTVRKTEQEGRTGILAIVGVAGTTETGAVDPLPLMADVCREKKIHFHVDAAWGGPTLLSEKYRDLLYGIQGADSVTIDGHKQFYMPMACGMVYFKDPTALDAVAYHARYVNRPGSADLGIKHISGSRRANSLILGSALKIMGTKGYALLIDHGIETARAFAEIIDRHPEFELITPPTLNILTYRLCPAHLRKGLADSNPKTRILAHRRLNGLNIRVQRQQREAGRSFVSRTTLSLPEWGDTVVLRCVIMNPMTTLKILEEILEEQVSISRNTATTDPMNGPSASGKNGDRGRQ